MELDKHQKQVQKWVKKWGQLLGVHTYSAELFFEENQISGKEHYYAEVASDPVYRTFKISIYPKFWDQTQEQRERTIIHELIHVVLARFSNLPHKLLNGELVTRNSVNEEEEHLTEHLTQIVFDLQS